MYNSTFCPLYMYYVEDINRILLHKFNVNSIPNYIVYMQLLLQPWFLSAHTILFYSVLVLYLQCIYRYVYMFLRCWAVVWYPLGREKEKQMRVQLSYSEEHFWSMVVWSLSSMFCRRMLFPQMLTWLWDRTVMLFHSHWLGNAYLELELCRAHTLCNL